MVPVARLLSLLIALAAYGANGAQAHLHMAGGETLEVVMCAPGSAPGSRFATMQLSDDGPVEETETCCGDCTAPSLIPVDPPVRPVAPASPLLRARPSVAPIVYPRSPLWPGAPPQGPPSLCKA